MKPTNPEVAAGMDCIVVGGCANGLLLKKIRMDATWIELQRPDYIKPLASAFQENPDIMHESDKYEVHPISLKNSDQPRPAIFGIAVVEGESLTWAFTQLVTGFVENYTRKLLDEGIITKQ